MSLVLAFGSASAERDIWHKWILPRVSLATCASLALTMRRAYAYLNGHGLPRVMHKRDLYSIVTSAFEENEVVLGTWWLRESSIPLDYYAEAIWTGIGYHARSEGDVLAYMDRTGAPFPLQLQRQLTDRMHTRGSGDDDKSDRSVYPIALLYGAIATDNVAWVETARPLTGIDEFMGHYHETAKWGPFAQVAIRTGALHVLNAIMCSRLVESYQPFLLHHAAKHVANLPMLLHFFEKKKTNRLGVEELVRSLPERSTPDAVWKALYPLVYDTADVTKWVPAWNERIHGDTRTKYVPDRLLMIERLVDSKESSRVGVDCNRLYLIATLADAELLNTSWWQLAWATQSEDDVHEKMLSLMMRSVEFALDSSLATIHAYRTCWRLVFKKKPFAWGATVAQRIAGEVSAYGYNESKGNIVLSVVGGNLLLKNPPTNEFWSALLDGASKFAYALITRMRRAPPDSIVGKLRALVVDWERPAFPGSVSARVASYPPWLRQVCERTEYEMGTFFLPRWYWLTAADARELPPPHVISTRNGPLRLYYYIEGGQRADNRICLVQCDEKPNAWEVAGLGVGSPGDVVAVMLAGGATLVQDPGVIRTMSEFLMKTFDRGPW